MSKKLFVAAFVLCFAVVAFAGGPGVARAVDETLPVDGGSVMWKIAPTSATGFYWGYDNVESGPPWIGYPAIGTATYTWVDVPGTSGASKLAPYSDRPWPYPLPDSFWYYGHWYKPGDELFLSPDGWISFDARIENDGAPNPPLDVPRIPVATEPNELMAALWANYDPTLTAEPSNINRVWYYYNTTNRLLTVQWNQVKSAANPTNIYTFEEQLFLGGQGLLDTRGSCGVIFSRHFVTCQYNTVSGAGWTGDNGLVGIENQAGDNGIMYAGTVANGRCIRFGYKKIFKHDIQSTQFLSPSKMVLRWTDIEPKVVVTNVGTEAEHFPVTLKIYDDVDGSEVYNENLGSYDLMPGASQTMVGPCWTPGELILDPTHTYTKKLIVALATDECKANDTLIVVSYVGCDDTLGYDWNFGDASPGPNNGWVIAGDSWGMGTYIHFGMTSYDWAGGLVMGARVYCETGSWAPNWSGSYLEMRKPTTGCGITNSADANQIMKMSIPSWGPTGPLQGWNDAPVTGMGVWVAAWASPGNVWAVNRTDPTKDFSPGTDASWFTAYGLKSYPATSPCYEGAGAPGPGRSALIYYGTWYWGCIDPYGSINSAWAQTYQPAIEIVTHLAMTAKPAPPCYYDEPHDIACYEMRSPDKNFIEAGVAINPELAIANIGRQTEPDGGFFPVKFIAYEGTELKYEDSTLISKIGWLGNAADNPDTLIVALNPWTPESVCKDYVSEDNGPFVLYDLIGLARLGEVGPDESDHCPYNDTVKHSLVSLWSHDVGVIDLNWPEEPDSPPDFYNPGSTITATATVENFGYNSENNVPVRLEVMDLDSNVLLWNNVQNLSFLDWRGNTLDNPFVVDVPFPPYVVINTHRQSLEARTELEGDQCPEDDYCIKWGDITEDNRGLPAAYSLDAANGVIKYDVPKASRVKIEVYDIGGRWVKCIENDICRPGRYARTWDGFDNAGRKVAAGIYFVRMEAEGFNATKKLVLVK